MSKMIVFDLSGKAVGDFSAVCERGWAIGGCRDVTAGGQMTVALPEEIVSKSWMQFGSLAMVLNGNLPPWVGMIDTPWNAILPAQATLYNSEYLLTLRTPDVEEVVSGDTEKIMRRMVEIANAQGEMRLRIGNVSVDFDRTVRSETIKQTMLWDQFQALGERTATEFVTRPVIEGGLLTIYIDLAKRQGVETSYLLFDGQGGNMQITEATLDGDIFNRVIAIGDESTAESRLQTAPYLSAESVTKYRLRSTVAQFNDVIEEVTLVNNALGYLNSVKQPYLKLNVEVHDSAIYQKLRLGNSFTVLASEIYLPGGRIGWKGSMRAMVLTHNESRGTVSMLLSGAYNG